MPKLSIHNRLHETQIFNTGQGFVSLKFFEEFQELCFDLVNNHFDEANLYYATEKPHISGNVSDTLHATLCFGYNSGDNLDKLAILEGVEFPEYLVIKNIEFNWNEVYRYYVLMITYDVTPELKDIANKLKSLESNPEHQQEFNLHSTLAYINANISQDDMTIICKQMFEELNTSDIYIKSIECAEFDSYLMEYSLPYINKFKNHESV
jgi:hypothetical protein